MKRAASGNRYQRLVLEHMQRCGAEGCTAEEATAALDMDRNNVAPRFTELAKIGSIVDSGRRRATAHGKSATVWLLAEKAQLQTALRYAVFCCPSCGWSGTEPQVTHTFQGRVCPRCGLPVQEAPAA